MAIFSLKNFLSNFPFKVLGQISPRAVRERVKLLLSELNFLFVDIFQSSSYLQPVVLWKGLFHGFKSKISYYK